MKLSMHLVVPSGSCAILYHCFAVEYSRFLAKKLPRPTAAPELLLKCWLPYILALQDAICMENGLFEKM